MNYKEKIKTKFQKMNRNTLIRRVIAFSMVTITMTYFLSPISSLKNYELSGNTFISIDDIYNYLEVKENQSLYAFDVKKAEKKLDEAEIISDYDISVNPLGIKIYVHENAPGAIYNNKIIGTSAKEYTSSASDSFSKNYIEKYSKHLPILLGELKESKNMTIALEMISKINSDNKYIYYLDSLTNENIFSFYYNVGSNGCLKINIHYDDNYPMDTYVEKFMLSQEELGFVYEACVEKNGLDTNVDLDFQFSEVDVRLVERKTTVKQYTY